MTWCCQVVSTETAMAAHQALSAPAHQRRVCGARRNHRISSTLMCSDGARLYGRSKAVSASNSKPSQPGVGGRSKAKRSGNAA